MDSSRLAQLFTFTRPEAGIWRITPSGDWTNAGRISFDVDVWTTEEPWPQHTARAQINQGDQHAYALEVPPGTASLGVRLEWRNMLGHYPVNDVDVILRRPDETFVFGCATIRAPELCSVADPQAGIWTAIVHGFSVIATATPGGEERYSLRVTADGTVLRPQP